MKRNALALALAAGVVATAAWAHGGMGGMGMGGMGMGGGCMEGMQAERLSLTAEQRQAVATIREETVAKRFELMGEMHKLRQKDLRAGTSPAADLEELSKLRQKAWDLGKSERERIAAVLTDEQRKELAGRWGAFAWRR